MRALARLPVHLYRLFLSPLVGGHCRFRPTCSAYALEAIDRHGAVKGGLLAAGRLCRCHPFCRCGSYDPVPETFAWASLIGYKNAPSVNPDTPHADE
jgi:putative membrane protein insertion efficiency factor